jgi:hypothetical protein
MGRWRPPAKARKPAIGGLFRRFLSGPPEHRRVAGDAVLIAPVSGRNSLQTGNFTGNFAEFGPKEMLAMQETPLSQRFLARFPTKIIREIIFNNRDFSALTREHRTRFRRPLVLREKIARGRIAGRLANVPRCLIGIEAGMATHYVAREP